MNEMIRWVIGILFMLIVGSFSYTSYSNSNLEERLTHQLDLIDGKIDKIIEHQWNDDRRRNP